MREEQRCRRRERLALPTDDAPLTAKRQRAGPQLLEAPVFELASNGVT